MVVLRVSQSRPPQISIPKVLMNIQPRPTHVVITFDENDIELEIRVSKGRYYALLPRAVWVAMGTPRSVNARLISKNKIKKQ